MSIADDKVFQAFTNRLIAGEINPARLELAAYIDAQMERDRKDAMRYRWLRTCDWFGSSLCVLRDPKKVLTTGSGLGADCPSRDRLDQAIDAELAKNKKEIDAG